MDDGRYQALSGRGALLPDAISTACSNITKKALPDAGMEQAGVRARACVPELLPVPSQGIKLDIPRRHRTAQRSPSSAAASRRTAVKRLSAPLSFCSDTRSTVKKPTRKVRLLKSLDAWRLSSSLSEPEEMLLRLLVALVLRERSGPTD